MRAALLALAIAAAALAHPIGYSTARLVLSGSEGLYELRVPLHDVQGLPGAAEALMGQVHFTGAGVAAVPGPPACQAEGQQFVCRAQFHFPAGAVPLRAHCDFAATLGHAHVHHLAVVRGTEQGNAFFESAMVDQDIPLRSANNGAWIGAYWSSTQAWLTLFTIALAAPRLSLFARSAGLLLAAEAAAWFLPISLEVAGVAACLTAAAWVGETLFASSRYIWLLSALLGTFRVWAIRQQTTPAAIGPGWMLFLCEPLALVLVWSALRYLPDAYGRPTRALWLAACIICAMMTATARG